MKHISIVSIPVTDPQRAKDFYLKVGFELRVESAIGPNQTWIQLGIPGAKTSVTLVNWFPQMQAGSLRGLVIDVDDIEASVEAIKAKGVDVGPIEKMPWGKFAKIIDPDGNELSLHE
ncbi:VOC family protein [Mucilaginibacter myungsuensis]|uniref:VOC family protein n=1 Tax=Mucilaginibacter myungsuensis TaxID=649104 RepID=A0A929PZC9_9SPHI|nr:VOC family protein [Mucilaginibacter myungsuensis]MBE9664282.1 VOC family protein [Mucilaginibacter myungsuensis]MDN3599986.1 VOC family protein [Mucilaginibacter myungsuensis]